MSYLEAKAKYAALGIDTDAAIARLKTVPVALHCWQGDDVGGFDQKEILRYFRSPLSPLDPDTCDMVENYAILWGIRGKAWTKPCAFSIRRRTP